MNRKPSSLPSIQDQGNHPRFQPAQPDFNEGMRCRVVREYEESRARSLSEKLRAFQTSSLKILFPPSRPQLEGWGKGWDEEYICDHTDKRRPLALFYFHACAALQNCTNLLGRRGSHSSSSNMYVQNNKRRDNRGFWNTTSRIFPDMQVKQKLHQSRPHLSKSSIVHVSLTQILTLFSCKDYDCDCAYCMCPDN